MRVLSVLISLLPLAAMGQTINPAFQVFDKPAANIVKPANEGLFAFRQGDLYGFMDRNMKTVIQPEFQFGNPKYNVKWGVMNEKGDMIVQPKYDSVKAFVGYRAAVRLGSLWSVIDERDNKVLDFKYDFIELGGGGLITFRDKRGGWSVMHASGEQVFPESLKHATVFNAGKGIVRGAYKPVIVRSPLAR
jgi:hypothetical protein